MMADADWIDRFPGLAGLPRSAREALRDVARPVTLQAGASVFGYGQTPEAYLLVVEGSVRVQQISESGREIVLYRVGAGESCALTTACLMGHEDYIAEAVAESDVSAIAIPRPAFDKLIAAEPAFRQFVFTAFSHLLTGLFHIIDDVAFKRMDIRLAQKLIELCDGENHVARTHQQLAAELGSAREVVSRLLHEFARRGWIASSRGTVEILDRHALQRLGSLA